MCREENLREQAKAITGGAGYSAKRARRNHPEKPVRGYRGADVELPDRRSRCIHGSPRSPMCHRLSPVSQRIAPASAKA